MYRSLFALTCSLALAAAPQVIAQPTVVDFEDLSLGKPMDGSQPYTVGSDTLGYYYNGSADATGFMSRGATFNNDYNFGFPAGWFYSNVYDQTTPGFMNQYAAYNSAASIGVGSTGAGGSANYGVAFQAFDFIDPFPPIVTPTITLPAGFVPDSIQITNTTYAALSMKNGDDIAKKFGDGDYFLLTITGLNAANAPTGSVDFYLADFRYDDATMTYKHSIVDNWTQVDLSSLGAGTQTLSFSLTSSDNGMFGMNTPAYFAADNLVLTPTPEPVTTGLIAASGLAAVCAWCRRRTAA